MTVVSDRDLGGHVVLDRLGPEPTLRGPGSTRLWCGHCGELLVEGVEPARLEALIFRCRCGAYNRPIPAG